MVACVYYVILIGSLNGISKAENLVIVFFGKLDKISKLFHKPSINKQSSVKIAK